MEHRLVVGGPLAGYEDYETALAAEPVEPLPEEWEGQSMLYSGGTTGLPKGVKPFLLKKPAGEPMVPVEFYSAMYRVPDDAVVLLTAPLYHNAQVQVLLYSARRGDTQVIMERFDPEATLAAIERYRVTFAQFVPAMFVRMLKLPEEVAQPVRPVVAARWPSTAPPPAPSRSSGRMIDWWGPILLEYYGATEPVGGSFIDSHEWLAHPGSVGRSALGPVHILDEEGNELPPGSPACSTSSRPRS